jgi:methylmalonyl-CoA/ethylmalonyl-CoA epimerase
VTDKPQQRDLEATRQWLADRNLAKSVGIEFVELTRGRCVGEWRPDPQWLNPNGSLPGAMLAAFGDHIAGSAVLSTIGPDDYTATVELDMRFVRAAFKTPITGVAEVVRKGMRLAFVNIEMREPDGRDRVVLHREQARQGSPRGTRVVSAAGVRQVDHICLAVRDVERACRLFIDVMGGAFVGGGDNPKLGVRAIQIKMGKMKVELLQPLEPGGYLERYIEKHGEGFHHLTMYVDDVEATDTALRAAGYDTVDLNTEPDDWKETFLRPSSAFGALIQLSTPKDPWPDRIPGLTLEDILEGRVQVLDNVVSWKATGEQVWPR